jgi:hypothetical protein
MKDMPSTISVAGVVTAAEMRGNKKQTQKQTGVNS